MREIIDENDFYTDADPNVAQSFDNNWNADQSNIFTSLKFDFRPITEFQVCKIVKNIKLDKSCAIEDISTRLLVKGAFEILTPELTYIYNKCIEKGDFMGVDH